MSSSPAFITRLTLRNYKSIASCSLNLSPLTFLVGPNGSGKSNCLDSLRFVAESLRTSLDHALRDRGTIKEVRRRSGGHPNHFAIRLDFRLNNGSSGHYSFEVGASGTNRFEVGVEECVLRPAESGPEAAYRIERGQVVTATVPLLPKAVPDRLFLVAASGLPEFRPVFDALSQIEIYNLNPREIAAMQRPDPGHLLRRDGGNAASVFQTLPDSTRSLVNAYLQRIVGGISGVELLPLGTQETLEFRQAVRGQKHPWRFHASSMSDGTLRAFGVLLALFQRFPDPAGGPTLIGIEEPEMALHPAATGVLLAALRDAASRTQVLVTSHSPDLLDDDLIPTESLLAVEGEEGVTTIAPISDAGRSLLREKLFTAGELLRQNQLAPAAPPLQDPRDDPQLALFELGGR